MQSPSVRRTWMLFAATILALAPAIHLAGQSSTAAASGARIPRAADGHPDLSGMWTNATLTPLERPETFGGRLVATEGEAAKYAREFLAANDIDRRDGDARVDVQRAYNNAFLDRGTELATVDGQRRTSLIIDPADGHIPPMTPEAQRRLGSRRAPAGGAAAPAARRESDNVESGPPVGTYDNPEERPLAERCLLSFSSSSGPPMQPVLYNNHYQIVQAPGYVMILVEMVHDARIIPIDNRPHRNERRWTGDSVGHWEGDTLVVDTINFRPQVSFRGSSDRLHVVERFTRIDKDTINYRFTIDDPTTWTKTWTGEMPFRATNEQLFEYACHEGNYALGDIMRGARLLEREAAAK